MRFDVISLFPEMFNGPLDHSIIKRAQEKRIVSINLHNLRDFAIDERGTVDDRPYGGGVGMILMVEPVYRAIKKVKLPETNTKVILMDPRGNKFTQNKAREYSLLGQLVIICGRYEGVDERVGEHLVDEAVSMGDFVLTGGELPAMTIIDSVTRLLPGTLEKAEATQYESFAQNEEGASILEHPQYTRPEEFNGWKIPEILKSGNHLEIKKWRDQKQTKIG